MKYIHIDITDYFEKLYDYTKSEILDENVRFNTLIKSIIETIFKPILINIGIHQFIIKKDLITNKFLIYDCKEENTFYADVVIFMCRKIALINATQVKDILETIVSMIIANFLNQKNNKYENVRFGCYENTPYWPKYHENNISNFTDFEENIMKKTLPTFSGQYFEPISTERIVNNQNYKEIVNSFLLNNFEDNVEFYLASECSTLRIQNDAYIIGIIDAKLSFLNIQSLPHNNIFVTRIKKFLENEYCYHFKKILRDQKCCDFFDKKLNGEDEIRIELELQNLNESNKSIMEGQISSKLDVDQLLLSNNEVKDDTERKNGPNATHIEIYHFEKSLVKNVRSIYTQNHNFQKSQAGLTKFALNEFVIKKTNFHFILEQTLELQSMNKVSSFIKKKTTNSYSQIKIQSCFVLFLPNSYLTMNYLYLFQCVFTSAININANNFSLAEHYLKIQNSFLNVFCCIFDFLIASSINSKNIISLHKYNLYYFIELENYQVQFCDSVPNTFVDFKLDNCDIKVKNKILHFNDQISKNEKENIRFSLDITEEISNLFCHENCISFKIFDSTLPNNLQICGELKYFKIVNCVSSFNLDASVATIKIRNHQGEISIQNNVKKALPRKKQNIILINKKYLKIENFNIDILQNLKVEILILRNCYMKNIKNIRCKTIKITNTMCAFKLIKSKKHFSIFSSNSLNIQHSQNTYMVLK